MDKIIIKILKLFSGLFSQQGVDTGQMFDIVETKIQMDKRRVHFQFRQQKIKDENANKLNYVFLMYGIFSLLIAIMIGMMNSIVLGMIIFHSYLLFMMAMTLITDFSSVLLDTTDNLVILPRPVSSKTLFVSRMVHVSIYLFQFGFVMSAFPVIATAIKFGIASGLFCIVTSFATVLLSVFITYLLYLAILKFSSERKLREIVTYFQIFMAVLFMAGYQIVPRLINFSAIEQSFSLQWYSYIAPPVWMAVAIEAVEKNIYDNIHIGMIILSIVLPVLLFWMLNKYFAPVFSRKLSMVQEDGTVQSKTRTEKQYKRKISEKLSPLLCKSPIERAGFEITWKISGRDKQFRLQFYPLLGYIAVLIFIFVLRDRTHEGNILQNLRYSRSFLWFIYVPLFMVSSSLSFVAFNESYQAAWVYYSLPIDKPGHIVSGSLKTLFVKFFFPVFMIMFIFSFSVWGVAIIDDFIFGLIVNFNCFLIMANLSKHYLPFSMQPNVQQQTGRFLNAILFFILIALLIGLHILGLKYPILLYALIPVTIFTAYLLTRSLQQLKWYQITI